MEPQTTERQIKAEVTTEESSPLEDYPKETIVNLRLPKNKWR